MESLHRFRGEAVNSHLTPSLVGLGTPVGRVRPDAHRESRAGQTPRLGSVWGDGSRRDHTTRQPNHPLPSPPSRASLRLSRCVASLPSSAVACRSPLNRGGRSPGRPGMAWSERTENSLRAIVTPCMTRRNNALLGTSACPLEFDVPLLFIITLDGPRAFHRAM